MLLLLSFAQQSYIGGKSGESIKTAPIPEDITVSDPKVLQPSLLSSKSAFEYMNIRSVKGRGVGIEIFEAVSDTIWVVLERWISVFMVTIISRYS